MTSRKLITITALYGVILSSPASARSNQHPLFNPQDDVHSFDLARHGARREEGRHHRLGGDLDARGYKPDQLGPHFSYSPAPGGPTVEFGALGAGRKGRPKLAHVGVDWSF